MEEIKTTYISLTLDEKGTEALNLGKEKTGIKNNSDFIRLLISKYARQENE